MTWSASVYCIVCMLYCDLQSSQPVPSGTQSTSHPPFSNYPPFPPYSQSHSSHAPAAQHYGNICEFIAVFKFNLC